MHVYWENCKYNKKMIVSYKTVKIVVQFAHCKRLVLTEMPNSRLLLPWYPKAYGKQPVFIRLINKLSINRSPAISLHLSYALYQSSIRYVNSAYDWLYDKIMSIRLNKNVQSHKTYTHVERSKEAQVPTNTISSDEQQPRRTKALSCD